MRQFCSYVFTLGNTGPLSQTQRELWFLLTQRQLPSTLPNVTTAEAALNSQTSSLQKGLLGQSSSNGTQILIANALWTNKTTLRQQYTKNMMTLFQVSSSGLCLFVQRQSSLTDHDVPAAALYASVSACL